MFGENSVTSFLVKCSFDHLRFYYMHTSMQPMHNIILAYMWDFPYTVEQIVLQSQQYWCGMRLNHTTSSSFILLV